MLSVPSDQAASVSVSMHSGDPAPAAWPRSVSRSNRVWTALINDLLEVQRPGVIRDGCEARRDLILGQPHFVAELPFDLASNQAT